MTLTNYEGIDYALGMANIDPETGIRFGVINQHAVDWWPESSEAIYPECEECDDEDECECDFDPVGFKYEGDEYKAFAGESGDIFVEKSAFFTFAQFCSPCAPGACHLENPLDHQNRNNKCYCFGHDMFDDNAPYPVYEVATGKLVKGS